MKIQSSIVLRGIYAIFSVNSAGLECHPYKLEVVSSNLTPRTIFACWYNGIIPDSDSGDGGPTPSRAINLTRVTIIGNGADY